VLGHVSAQGGSGTVASNAAVMEEVGNSQCGAVARCMGRLLGQSLGPARDEQGPFSICSKKFN
jgi:hypothetical protein